MELINKIIDYNYGEFGTEFGDALVDLKNENIELQDRINKAIKRIEKELSYTPSSTRKEVGLILVDYKKLLNILKGDNKKYEII